MLVGDGLQDHDDDRVALDIVTPAPVKAAMDVERNGVAAASLLTTWSVLGTGVASVSSASMPRVSPRMAMLPHIQASP